MVGDVNVCTLGSDFATVPHFVTQRRVFADVGRLSPAADLGSRAPRGDRPEAEARASARHHAAQRRGFRTPTPRTQSCLPLLRRVNLAAKTTWLRTSRGGS